MKEDPSGKPPRSNVPDLLGCLGVTAFAGTIVAGLLMFHEHPGRRPPRAVPWEPVPKTSFLREDPLTTFMLLGGGIGLAALCMFLSGVARRRLKRSSHSSALPPPRDLALATGRALARTASSRHRAGLRVATAALKLMFLFGPLLGLPFLLILLVTGHPALPVAAVLALGLTVVWHHHPHHATRLARWAASEGASLERTTTPAGRPVVRLHLREVVTQLSGPSPSRRGLLTPPWTDLTCSVPVPGAQDGAVEVVAAGLEERVAWESLRAPDHVGAAPIDALIRERHAAPGAGRLLHQEQAAAMLAELIDQLEWESVRLEGGRLIASTVPDALALRPAHLRRVVELMEQVARFCERRELTLSLAPRCFGWTGGQAGPSCPYCREALPAEPGTETVTACERCGTVHHRACLEEARGCTVFGCRPQRAPREVVTSSS